MCGAVLYRYSGPPLSFSPFKVQALLRNGNFIAEAICLSSHPVLSRVYGRTTGRRTDGRLDGAMERRNAFTYPHATRRKTFGLVWPRPQLASSSSSSSRCSSFLEKTLRLCLGAKLLDTCSEVHHRLRGMLLASTR